MENVYIIFCALAAICNCRGQTVTPSTEKRITIDIPKQQRPDDDWYSYTGLQPFGYSVGNRTVFQFSVRACSGAHVALMSGPTDKHGLYEIIISGYHNSESVVRKYKGGAVVIKSHGGMLDCSELKSFQIHWKDGVISLVRKCRLGKWLHVLRWKDSEPRPVRYIGVARGWWTSSTWEFYVDNDYALEDIGFIQFETTQQRGPQYHYTNLEEYSYDLGQRSSIRFSVKACSGINVALLSRNTGTCAMYEVLIGGYRNTLSVIRRGKNRYNHVTKPSSPADCNSFRSFVVTWAMGVITVWYESEDDEWRSLMWWRDPSPIDVRYIGVTTGLAASGTWKVTI